MTARTILSPEKRAAVKAELLKGTKPIHVAIEQGISSSCAYYIRERLECEGLMPRRKPEPPRAPREAVVGGSTAPQPLCLVNECYARPTFGHFCEVHSAVSMKMRATAGMSAATRRKLTGARA